MAYVKKLLRELTERAASMGSKFDSWWGTDDQQDGAAEEQENGIDVEEALGQMIENEARGSEQRLRPPPRQQSLGDVPGATFNVAVAATDTPRTGEQGPQDNGWYDLNPMRQQPSLPPSFGAEGTASRGPPLGLAALPAPSHATSHQVDHLVQQFGTGAVEAGQSSRRPIHGEFAPPVPTA